MTLDSMLDQPSPPPLPPLDMDSPLTAAGKRPVGRPAISAEQRALSDMKYAAMMQAIEALPVEATEYRFGVYPARRRVDAKAEFHPLCKILLSEWNQNNFKDMSTLANYLGERFGSGRYVVEALDSFNRRLDKIAPLYVTSGDPEMIDDDLDDEEYEDSPPRRRRTRRLRDDELDDPVSERANMADLLITNARQASGTAAVAARSQTDMMTVLMLSNTAQTEARAAEERRREDARAEERRREDIRSEERRKEAQEERRREDEKLERERKDERDREERRRAEAAEQRAKDEDRRNRDHLAALEASNKKTEMLIAAISAGAPVLGKMFEKRESPMEVALTRSLTEKKEADPMMVMLLQSTLAKGDRQDSTQVMMQQMAEFSKISSQMTADQMRIMMTTSSDFNKEMMKKAMDLMLASPHGQTPEGKNFIEQVMGAIAGASEFAKAIFPHQPAPVQQAIQAPQQRRALPHQRQAQPQQPQQPQPAQAAQPAQQPTLTPEQQAQADNAPKGVMGVLAALMAIHGHQYQTQDQYQSLIHYCLSQMPVDLRVNIIEGNEANVFAIVQPYYEAVPELKAWITKPDVLLWIRDYVPKLSPHILQMHGSHDEQRAQLMNLLAQQQREDEEARLAVDAAAQGGAPAPAPAQPGNVVQQPAEPPQPGNAVDPAVHDAAMAQQPPAPGGEGDLAVTPDGASAPAEPTPADQVLPANPQLMAGAAVGGAVAVPVAPTPGASSGSHLDDPDAP